VVIQRTNAENNIGASLLKVTGQQFGANIATPFFGANIATPFTV